MLSLTALSHGVVRVDTEGSLTALTLQDCGMVIPGAKVVIVKPSGEPHLCKCDEVHIVCLFVCLFVRKLVSLSAVPEFARSLVR